MRMLVVRIIVAELYLNLLCKIIGDPRAFTILYTIEASRFDRALYDFSVSINLMPLVEFK